MPNISLKSESRLPGSCVRLRASLDACSLASGLGYVLERLRASCECTPDGSLPHWRVGGFLIDDGNEIGERVSALDQIKEKLLAADLARWRKELR